MPRDNRSPFVEVKARILEGFESASESALIQKLNTASSGIFSFPAGRDGVGKCARITGTASFVPTYDALYPIDDRWVSFGAAIRSSGASDSDIMLIRGSTLNGSHPHVILRMAVSGAFVRYELLNASTGSVYVRSQYVPEETWVYVEAQVYVHDSEGEGVIRFDGAPVGWVRGADFVGAITVPTKAKVENIEHSVSITGGWIEIDDLYVIQGANRDAAPMLGPVRVAQVLANGVGLGGQTWNVFSSPTHHEAIDESDADSDSTYLYTSVDAVDAFTRDGPDLTMVPGPVELVGATIDGRLDAAEANVRVQGIIGDLTDFRTAIVSDRNVPNLVYDDRGGASSLGLHDRRLERQARDRMEVGILSEFP